MIVQGLVVACLLLAVPLSELPPEKACSHTQRVTVVLTPGESRIAPLPDLAQQNRISFGIESVLGLDSTDVPVGSVATVVRVLLGHGSKVALRCVSGAIVISGNNAADRKLFDPRVPVFRLKKC